MERGAPRLTALALTGLLVLLAACSDDESITPGPLSSPGSTLPSETSSPQSAEIEATIEVGADPIGIAAGEGSLWVVNADINAKEGSV